MNILDKYETVIGLEVHIQLSTKSKAFCADDTRFGGEPNTHISAISLGHPGTLPRLNKQQVDHAIRLGLALGCEINKENRFDRKNYFYADLPKGYQITQDRAPICLGGKIEIPSGESKRTIRLHHIHMEEDAGKSIHDLDPNYTLIDLNRAGVPLVELVTEPDFRSAEEVDVFMNTMRQLVRYLEISDGNMEEGSMRCDVNVSVRLKGASEYGERCEIKNVNSMRFARRAITYEVKRQINLLESGGQVQQQTLNFDPETGVTSPLRDKEDAHDYRYFPEPDLPPILLNEKTIEDIRAQLPALPWDLVQDFSNNYGLSEYDANLLTEEKNMALYFKEICQSTKSYKSIANFLINKVKPWLKEQKVPLADFPLSTSQVIEFTHLIDDGKVSASIAYQRLFPALIEKQASPLALATSMNLIQNSDEDFLEKLINDVLAKQPDKVKAYKNGKKNLLGMFMGEVMRQSKGKADPKATNQMLREKLK